MKVDLQELFNAFAIMRRINKEKIHDVEWTLNGETVEIDKALLDRWQYIGLNNTDFPRYAFDKDSDAGKLFLSLLSPDERKDNESV